MTEQTVLNPLTMTEGEFVDAVYQRVLNRSDIEELKDDIVEFYNFFYSVQYWDILDSFDDKLLVNKKRTWNYNQIEQTCPQSTSLLIQNLITMTIQLTLNIMNVEVQYDKFGLKNAITYELNLALKPKHMFQQLFITTWFLNISKLLTKKSQDLVVW